MSQEPSQAPKQAEEDDLLTLPMVARRRAQWQRLTEEWRPLSAAETAELVDWMRNEARKQKRWRQGRILLLTSVMSGFLVLLLGHYLWDWKMAGYAGLLNLLTIFNLGLMLAWNSEAHKKKLALLSNLTDVHLVGPLCEIAVSVNRDMRVLAQDALIRMLPRLQTSDAIHFTAAQRECLYSLLYANDVGLVRVILKSLAQVGDGKAFPYVQNLANGKYLAARDLRVRVVAECCLPFLENLARQEQISQTLLRPAAPESGDTLLRGTAHAQDTPPQELLRAAQGSREES